MSRQVLHEVAIRKSPHLDVVRSTRGEAKPGEGETEIEAPCPSAEYVDFSSLIANLVDCIHAWKQNIGLSSVGAYIIDQVGAYQRIQTVRWEGLIGWGPSVFIALNIKALKPATK